MKLLLLLAAVMFLPQEKKNEAEELFKGLEDKLSKASTIEVEFITTFDQEKRGKKVSGSFTGAVRLKEANLARLELDGKIVEPMKYLIISDGKSMVPAHEDPALVPPAETSATLKRDATLLLARMGGMGTLMEWHKHLLLLAGERRMAEAGGKVEPRETDPRKTLRLGAFKSGEAAKIDGRDSIAIQYEVEEVGKPLKAQITLWIDAATRLPLRRRMSDEKIGVLIEETYKVFKAAEKLDPALFELPK